MNNKQQGEEEKMDVFEQNTMSVLDFRIPVENKERLIHLLENTLLTDYSKVRFNLSECSEKEYYVKIESHLEILGYYPKGFNRLDESQNNSDGFDNFADELQKIISDDSIFIMFTHSDISQIFLTTIISKTTNKTFDTLYFFLNNKDMLSKLKFD